MKMKKNFEKYCPRNELYLEKDKKNWKKPLSNCSNGQINEIYAQQVRLINRSHFRCSTIDRFIIRLSFFHFIHSFGQTKIIFQKNKLKQRNQPTKNEQLCSHCFFSVWCRSKIGNFSFVHVWTETFVRYNLHSIFNVEKFHFFSSFSPVFN